MPPPTRPDCQAILTRRSFVRAALAVGAAAVAGTGASGCGASRTWLRRLRLGS